MAEPAPASPTPTPAKPTPEKAEETEQATDDKIEIPATTAQSKPVTPEV